MNKKKRKNGSNQEQVKNEKRAEVVRKDTAYFELLDKTLTEWSSLYDEEDYCEL